MGQQVAHLWLRRGPRVAAVLSRFPVADRLWHTGQPVREGTSCGTGKIDEWFERLDALHTSRGSATGMATRDRAARAAPTRLQRRGPRPRTEGGEGVRGAPRREVAQGDREDHRLPRRAADVHDFPAEHWIHLRTANPIESTLRHRLIPAAGHQEPGLQGRWHRHGVQALLVGTRLRRAVSAPHLVALVRAGAIFEEGKVVERPDESEGGQKVA